MAVCFNCAAQDSKRRDDPPHDDLELVDRHPSSGGEVLTYRCRECGAEVEHTEGALQQACDCSWAVLEATGPSGP